MSLYRVLVAAFALSASALAVSPVLAQSAGKQSASNSKPAVEQANASAEDDDDKIVCRKIRLTGTRIGQRACRTKGQWAAIEEAARESANTIKDAGALNTTPTPGN